MRVVAGEGAEWGFPAEGVKEFWCSCFWMLSIEEMACRLPGMNQFLYSCFPGQTSSGITVAVFMKMVE